MTDTQSQKERDAVPASLPTGQPSRKAPKSPKPRKVEKRQKGRKG
jgi:hypothetical protein